MAKKKAPPQITEHPLFRELALTQTMSADTLHNCLLKHSDELDCRDGKGNTIGHVLAAQAVSISLLTIASKFQIRFRELRNDLAAPIHLAANRRDEHGAAIVRWLCEHAGEDCNRPGPVGLQPLFIACHNDCDPVMITALVNSGADVNAQHPPRQWTPLHVAARFSSREEVIYRLLQHGADPNMGEIQGLKPADLIVLNKNLDRKGKGAILLKEKTYGDLKGISRPRPFLPYFNKGKHHE
ncbi:MAG: ankyrin repeat domain-containing protein [Paracoccaceae bacterium]|nr:ankyrin repeat domain-containing protein [Paracoccaceae bacterium]